MSLTFNRNNIKWWLAPVLAASLVIAGCGSDDSTGADNVEESPDTDDAGDTDDTNNPDDSADTDNNGDTDDTDTAGTVIINGVANDYSSAAVEIYNTSEPYEGQTELNGGVSDTIVRAHGDRYFVIRRFQSDSITAYHVDDPSSEIFQSSTNDGNSEESSNPHDMVFLNSEKAYLLRYGSGKIWIVNPSADSAAEFKTGEIDLSAYDADGVPEMTRGVIVDDKLYVVMQRLEGFAPTLAGAVAVIDTSSDLEIDTGTSGEFKGIELPVYNPVAVSIDESTGQLLIAASGDSGFISGTAQYNGGIAGLDTGDYSAELLIDDTEDTGRIINVQAMDADTAFTVYEAAWQNSSLVQFNPSTAEILQGDFGGITEMGIQSMAVSPAGDLWVGIGSSTEPRVEILDPDSGEQTGVTLNTVLDPAGIVFVE